MSPSISRAVAFYVSLCLMVFSSSVLAALCTSVFPDGASNTTSSGVIEFRWGAKVINSPDNQLATRNLLDGGGPNTSCNTSSCAKIPSGSPLASTGSFSGFVSGRPSFTATTNTTLAPGDYANLTVKSGFTLTLSPGTYTFNGSIVLEYNARVQVSAAGTTLIYANQQIELYGSGQINTTGTGSHVLLYSNSSITLQSSARVNAVVYSGGSVNLQGSAQVNGAVTAGGNIILDGEASITFNSATVVGGNFGTFCSANSTPPSPVAYWALDSQSYTGAANEVTNASGSSLHGRGVNLNGFPSSQINLPAKSGNPGTCRSASFDGTLAGYLQIDDPGTNSALDTSQYSIAFWVRPRALPASDVMTLLAKGSHWQVHLNMAGRLYWYWGSGDRSVTTSGSLALNTWHHVVVTYQSGSQSVYINGALAASHTSTTAIALDNSPITIGTFASNHNRRFRGYIDEVRLYSSVLNVHQVGAVMALTHACPAEIQLAEIDLDFPANASTCAPLEVAIEMVNNSGATMTGFEGPVTLSTTTGNGDWSKTATGSNALGTLTPGGSDSGSATYNFVAADAGTVRLHLTNHHAETLTVRVSEAGSGTLGTATVTFSANVLQLESTDTLGNDVVAGRPHALRLRMMRQDPLTGVCAVATGYQQTALKAWFTRSGADPGGTAPRLQSASTNLLLPTAQPAANNFAVAFSSGEASVTLNPSDVGQFYLQFRDDSAAFSDKAIVGTGPLLTVRPFGFHITVTGNPAAANASGAVFKAAGSDFSATIRAVAWQAADDANGDGLADGHADDDPANNADLSNNTSLARFGRESPNETVRLEAGLLLPVGGNNPGIASSVNPLVLGFSGGTATVNTLYFNEVGIIELKASINDGTYLSASVAPSGRSGRVGRFIPARFSLLDAAINAACTVGVDFSYMGQPMGLTYQLQALSARGSTTQNYQGSFARLALPQGLTFRALDLAAATPLSARLSHLASSGTWLSGTGTLQSQLQLNRGSVVDGPFSMLELGLAVEDSDAVAFASSDLDLDADLNSVKEAVGLGQTQVRFGRLRLDDAFGPETANLPVTMLTEYWDSAAWRTNTDDSCTRLGYSSVRYPAGFLTTSANRTVSVGGGSTVGTYPHSNASGIGFVSGDAGHYFTPPGAGRTGRFEVDINLGAFPWLQFDWNNDGNHAETSLPTAEYSFGMYRNHDRVLYWQELLRPQ